MSDREKLIELLGHVQYLGGLEEKIADHLIANGVVPVVRCGDCAYTAESTILGCVRCLEHGVTMRSTNYCAHGERKDDGKID